MSDPNANAPAHQPPTTPTDAVPAGTPDPLSDAEYNRLTQTVMAQIEATVDRWLEEDLIDIDTQRQGGLLEMKFPNGSHIIINTQPPLQELWLAARDGGFHFRCVKGLWLDTRDSNEFLAKLSLHASQQGGMALQFVSAGA